MNSIKFLHPCIEANFRCALHLNTPYYLGNYTLVYITGKMEIRATYQLDYTSNNN